MIKLLCGLGNPGKEYAPTRHNAGWMVLDALGVQLDWQKKFKATYAQDFLSPGKKLILLKPETFMNKSGESLRACMDFFSVSPEEILVVHDELEIPFGTIEIKQGGGLGGHNGLKSVVQHIGTRDFTRLRFGLGRPAHGNVSSYVLSRFSKDEEAFLPRYIDAAVRLIRELIA